MRKEAFLKTLEIAVPTAVLMYGTVFAFGRKVKDKVIERQGGRCADCGREGHLQCHHIVPQCLGGADTVDNAVALCPNDHLYWDNSTIRDGVMWGDRPIQEAPSHQIADRKKFNRGVLQILRRNGG